MNADVITALMLAGRLIANTLPRHERKPEARCALVPYADLDKLAQALSKVGISINVMREGITMEENP